MIEPIIYGLSNEDYHRKKPYSDYLSSSQIKLYLKSPRHAKFMLDNPTDDKSDALRFGSLFHDLMASIAERKSINTGLLEWYSHIALFQAPVNPKTDQPYGATTKVYKEAYEAFLSDNAYKIIADGSEVELCRDMMYSLCEDSGATSEQVRKLLRWAKATEVSYFYETEDGIKLKVRPDLLTRDKIVDWKTCSLDSLDEESVTRQIIKYRYDVSLSMYQWVLFQIEKKWYAPILVFVQKTAPFDAIMCDISEWCYDYNPNDGFVKPGVGALVFKRLLGLHTQCVKNDLWPGAENSIEADGDVRIMKPSVPYWLGIKYFEDY